MKLPNISTQDKKKWSTPSVDQQGFTLVEILIVMAIIAFIAVIGMITSLDTLNRYIFRSDTDKVVSLLQKARSSAMNNVNEKEYGVVLDDPDNLILFRETLGTSYDYKVEKSKTASYSDTCPSQKVIFKRLTGNSIDCIIEIIDGNKTTTITISSQGGINY